MADRRRRRALEDEGEETAATSVADKDKVVKARPSECESEGDHGDADIASEYESATEESRDAVGDEESEEGSEEETEEETEEGTEEEEDDEDYTDDDVIIEGEEHLGEERQSGDGEEQPDKENVDDDEDKKNPAYVPRKGAFYEHDLRTGEEDEQPTEELKPKKKLWQDEGKWLHDRFRDDLQAPKSREELIALYGYDIRASDKPPEAPPARKMKGRGRGRPQRQSKLADFMEPEKTRQHRPQPEPELEPELPTRMAVIDTTDYSSRPSHHRAPPPLPRPEAFEDFDEDIDVPYMTTIDTTESSADSYQPRGQRRRGAGPRQRWDRSSYGDNDSYDDRQHNYGDRQPYRDRQSNRDRGGGSYRSLNVSQDTRISQSQDSRISPRQDYSQDFPVLSRQSGSKYQGRDNYSQDVRGRDSRGQGDHRNNRGNHRVADEVGGMYTHRNNYNRSARGGSRGGGFDKPMRGRERNDRNNRPPRYSRMDREERPGNNQDSDLVPVANEYTNSSLRNNSSEGYGGKGTAVDVAKGSGSVKDPQPSPDVVISNKENVQTISVTITNTTTERKSYAKERRGKAGNITGVGPMGDATSHEDHKAAPPAMIEGATPHLKGNSGDQIVANKAQGEKRNQAGSSARQDSREQTRPKRYSSQRQRNMMELGYSESHQQQQTSSSQLPPPQQQQQQHQLQQQQHPSQHQPQQHPQHQAQQHQPQQQKLVPVDSAGSAYFKQAVYTTGPPAPLFRPEMAGAQRPNRPPPPQDAAAFGTAMLQPPISFHMPVSGPGMPSPPRLMGPNMAPAPPGPVPVPISNASPQLIPTSYLAPTGVMYSAPPPPPGASAPFQVTLGYTSPPPAAPPVMAQQPVASPQNQPEVHRGGTVYFPPYLQQPSSRSPARRPKVAIPIVDPTELEKKPSLEGSPVPEASSALPVATNPGECATHHCDQRDLGSGELAADEPAVAPEGANSVTSNTKSVSSKPKIKSASRETNASSGGKSASSEGNLKTSEAKQESAVVETVSDKTSNVGGDKSLDSKSVVQKGDGGNIALQPAAEDHIALGYASKESACDEKVPSSEPVPSTPSLESQTQICNQSASDHVIDPSPASSKLSVAEIVGEESGSGGSMLTSEAASGDMVQLSTETVVSS